MHTQKGPEGARSLGFAGQCSTPPAGFAASGGGDDGLGRRGLRGEGRASRISGLITEDLPPPDRVSLNAASNWSKRSNDFFSLAQLLRWFA